MKNIALRVMGVLLLLLLIGTGIYFDAKQPVAKKKAPAPIMVEAKTAKAPALDAQQEASIASTVKYMEEMTQLSNEREGEPKIKFGEMAGGLPSLQGLPELPPMVELTEPEPGSKEAIEEVKKMLKVLDEQEARLQPFRELTEGDLKLTLLAPPDTAPEKVKVEGDKFVFTLKKGEWVKLQGSKSLRMRSVPALPDGPEDRDTAKLFVRVGSTASVFLGQKTVTVTVKEAP